MSEAGSGSESREEGSEARDDSMAGSDSDGSHLKVSDLLFSLVAESVFVKGIKFHLPGPICFGGRGSGLTTKTAEDLLQRRIGRIWSPL